MLVYRWPVCDYDGHFWVITEALNDENKVVLTDGKDRELDEEAASELLPSVFCSRHQTNNRGKIAFVHLNPWSERGVSEVWISAN